MKQIKVSYCAVLEIFGRLWRAYGGVRALFVSPYLHASLVVAFFILTNKLTADFLTYASAFLPSVIGFSIGVFALVFALMPNDIKQATIIPVSGEYYSPMTKTSANFAWPVLIQIISIFCIIIKEYTCITCIVNNYDIIYDQDTITESIVNIFRIFTVTVTVYAIMLLFSLVVEIFRVSTFAARDGESDPDLDEPAE